MNRLAVNQTYNEKELLLRISEGDEKAFGILFTDYYPQVYALVHRFSLHDEDVREALQETFLSVWLHREQLTAVENIRGWLLRIASRKCRMMLRKNLLIRRTDNHMAYNDDTTGGGNPAEKMQATEVNRLVHEAIRQMPEQRLRIFTMSREDGLKPAQIAEQLQLSVSTVKNTLSAALKQIRDYLSDAGYHLPIIFLLFFYFD